MAQVGPGDVKYEHQNVDADNGVNVYLVAEKVDEKGYCNALCEGTA